MRGINGALWAHKYPFLHYTSSEVLSAASHDGLCASARLVINSRYVRKAANYDAKMVRLSPVDQEAFRPFLEIDVLSRVADVLQLPFLPYVDAAVHRHAGLSRKGWVHTDYCSAFFDSAGAHGEIIMPSPESVEYFSGRKRSLAARPVELIRAASLIYFLDNEQLGEGNEGSTGLYLSKTGECQKMILPESNSLLLFECTPHSWHRFEGLTSGSRSSLILWLHCTPEQARDRWGKHGANRGARNA